MSAADLPTLLAIPAPEAAPTYLPPPLTSEVDLLTMKKYETLARRVGASGADSLRAHLTTTNCYTNANQVTAQQESDRLGS